MKVKEWFQVSERQTHRRTDVLITADQTLWTNKKENKGRERLAKKYFSVLDRKQICLRRSKS